MRNMTASTNQKSELLESVPTRSSSINGINMPSCRDETLTLDNSAIDVQRASTKFTNDPSPPIVPPLSRSFSEVSSPLPGPSGLLLTASTRTVSLPPNGVRSRIPFSMESSPGGSLSTSAAITSKGAAAPNGLPVQKTPNGIGFNETINRCMNTESTGHQLAMPTFRSRTQRASQLAQALMPQFQSTFCPPTMVHPSTNSLFTSTPAQFQSVLHLPSKQNNLHQSHSFSSPHTSSVGQQCGFQMNSVYGVTMVPSLMMQNQQRGGQQDNSQPKKGRRGRKKRMPSTIGPCGATTNLRPLVPRMMYPAPVSDGKQGDLLGKGSVLFDACLRPQGLGQNLEKKVRGASLASQLLHMDKC